jgi:hydroxypyruvate reductase
MNASRFLTSSLRTNAWGTSVCRILAAAIQSVDPKQAVLHHLQRTGNQLIVSGISYNLDHYQQILVIGAGKAGAPMAEAIEEILPDRQIDGLVIIKEGYGSGSSSALPLKIKIVEGGHPIPDERSILGTNQISHILEQANQDTLVICLFSGGGSALFVSPVSAGSTGVSSESNITDFIGCCWRSFRCDRLWAYGPRHVHFQ